MLLLVFPHQLYCNSRGPSHPGLKLKPDHILLIEDSLFFGDSRYPAEFHKQKLWFHRATMKRYEAMLGAEHENITYVDYEAKVSLLGLTLKKALKGLKKSKRIVVVADPTDFILEKRLNGYASELDFELRVLPSPLFLNSKDENTSYRAGKKRWFMADFYKSQRKRLNVLMDGEEPAGGKWSFDEDNRKKIPKSDLKSIPDLLTLSRDEVDMEAKEYVQSKFAGNPGDLEELIYPSDPKSATKWFKHFLANRFEKFGDFEDAIAEGESWLWHSVLTPALNVGLISPDQVLRQTLQHADKHSIPLNSLEGFVRQVIGWREFMRATYEDLGVQMRTTNHWQHHRSMPKCFYDGTTGILPLDDVIRRLLKTGYCHHIERLMVLGGFMFLCEIAPEEIYRWFMEMFIDSYDWVMVPNVYAMSQNADGGLITTKPYFSGSAYVRKMSHYKKGEWCDVWDGLYWRWIWNHSQELSKNPRWAMMCSMAKKMAPEKRDSHLQIAENFLAKLK